MNYNKDFKGCCSIGIPFLVDVPIYLRYLNKLHFIVPKRQTTPAYTVSYHAIT